MVHGDVAAEWEAALAAERGRLVRLCAHLTGDRDAAEDLAQETLLKAWQHAQQLIDAERRARWLSAIARNECRRWRQRRTTGNDPDLAGPCRSPAGAASPLPADLDDLPDNFDVERELERDELTLLLDRAMALLPAATRTVLVQRFVDAAPQVEIARRLGTTEGAVEARVQRGKLTLRRLLATTFAADAAAHGLVAPGGGLQRTRLWCPGCGQHHLEGRLAADVGELFLRCPACTRIGTHAINSRMGDGLQGLGAYRPAVKRVLRSIHDLFQVLPDAGAVRCLGCGSRLPIRVGVPPVGALPFGAYPSPNPTNDGVYVRCAHCGFADNETWYSLAWSLPEVRHFWQQHPRMRFLPAREIAVAGRRAMHTGVESVTRAAKVDIVLLRDTGKALYIDGAPRPGWVE